MRRLYALPALVTILSVTTALQTLAQDSSENFSLLADDLSYDSQGTIVTAKGNVNIISNRGNLWADSLIYDAEAGKVVANGNITYVDKDDITIYLKEIELNNELQAGVLHDVQVQVGDDKKKGPKLAAVKAEKTADNIITLENAVYSPCEACGEDDDDLPWKIRAGKISYNNARGIATYDDAILDVYGTPVIYIPYFKHAVAERAEDGLLPPRFGSSTSRGTEVQGAYYKRFSAYQDATARLRYMSKRGAMLLGEHRYNSRNIYSTVRGSALNDDLTSSWRSHLETEMEYILQKGRRLGANINLASDDTYLDDFYDRNDSHLTSTLYAEDASPDHYYSASTIFYQDQTATGDDDRTAQVLPQFTLERSYKFNYSNTNLFTLSAQTLNLHRSEGTKYTRIATEANYSDVFIRPSGDRFDFTASLRADAYHVETDSTSTSGESGTHYRAVPQISLKWERPFVSQGAKHVVTPMAMVVLSPRGGNSDNIPNDDSVAYELDNSNLFDTNRFAGFDRIETGPRFIYGVDNTWGTAEQTKWRVFLGQSYRYFDDEVLPTTGGTETKASDIVGIVKVEPYDWLEFESKFRLDNASYETRRIDNSLIIGDMDESYLTITHSDLENGPEEVRVNGRYEISKSYAFEGEVRKDLEGDGRLLNTEGEFIYTHQCYRLSVKARRRGFDNRNVPPSTDYLLNIELLTLGRDYD